VTSHPSAKDSLTNQKDGNPVQEIHPYLCLPEKREETAVRSGNS